LKRGTTTIALLAAGLLTAAGVHATSGGAAAPVCAADPDPAADLLASFRQAAYAYRSPPGAEVRFNDPDQQRFVSEAATRLLVPQRELLRRHARWALARLPHEPPPEMSTWERIPLHSVVAAEILADRPKQQGVFDGQILMAFADPVEAVSNVQALAAGDGVEARKIMLRASALRGLAPPRYVWANADPDKPVLAIVKQTDVFVVEFSYDAQTGAYLPRREEWRKRPKAARAAAAPADPAEAAVRAYHDAIEAFDDPGEDIGPTAAYIRFKGNATAFATDVARQLLAPKAELMHRRARCNLLKLPYQALPPSSLVWRSIEIPTGGPSAAIDPAMILMMVPDAKWNPIRAFWMLRDWRINVSLPGTVVFRVLSDGVAPPVVVRANDDPDNPVLATIDHDEIFTASFHYDAASAGYAFVSLRLLHPPPTAKSLPPSP
jgi:hypothetical protein